MYVTNTWVCTHIYLYTYTRNYLFTDIIYRLQTLVPIFKTFTTVRFEISSINNNLYVKCYINDHILLFNDQVQVKIACVEYLPEKVRKKQICVYKECTAKKSYRHLSLVIIFRNFLNKNKCVMLNILWQLKNMNKKRSVATLKNIIKQTM